MIDLPIRFPKDADVIAEEAARFRSLSPQERMRSIRGVLSAGRLMIQNSPNPEYLRQTTQEQEDLAVKNIREFVARHVQNQRDSG